MGAGNALKACHAWGHLPDRPFRILSYMALRARDNDAAPWYGAGHDELASIALGLPMGTEREHLAALRAVSRAFKALHEAGAVTTHRYARPGKHATYLLWLDSPAPVDNRRKRTTPTVVRPSQNVRRSPSYEQADVRRSADKRTTPTVVQRSKEEEELHERSSSKSNLRNDDPWKTPRLRAVEDPWAEELRNPNGHRRTSP